MSFCDIPDAGKIMSRYDATIRHEEGRVIEPTQQDFQNLLGFRVALRRFQRWSEEHAAAVGLTHTQHQLLVAIKGHLGTVPPSVGEIADYLLLQTHSAVGLVDRAERAGVVRRRTDTEDARVSRVELTELGDRLVTQLTEAHLVELCKLADALGNLLPAWWTSSHTGAGKRPEFDARA